MVRSQYPLQVQMICEPYYDPTKYCVHCSNYISFDSGQDYLIKLVERFIDCN